jgi:pimeloyl-ACP methyl ester carboxylesterase
MAGHRITKKETDRFLDVNGIKIHYNEAGQGPALICLHGGGPGANAWDNTKHNIDALGEHFQVMLVDMPGFGESDKNVKLGDTPLDLFRAHVIRDFMDLKGIERSHLYGSSATGPGCLRFGLEYPGRIGKIVLQSSGPGWGILFVPMPTEGIKALDVFAKNPTRENMENIMRLFIPKKELCTEEMIEARFRAAMIPGHIAARDEFGAQKNSDLTKEVQKLEAEVLVVWGHQDRMVPFEGALTCLARIPNVRVHIWGGGTGHFVEYEKADEFNRLVIDFLTH